MTPLRKRGLILPVGITLATLIALALGGAAAALVVLAVGFVVFAAFHLRHLYRLQEWTASSLEHYTPLPPGAGIWDYVLAALSRREHKRVAFQTAQKQEIERLRKMAEALPDGVVVLDSEDRIDWANVRAQQWLALDFGKDAGRPLGNLVRNPDFLKFLESGRHAVGGENTGPENTGPEKQGQAGALQAGAPHIVLIRAVTDPARMLAVQQAPFGRGGRLLLVRDVTQREAVERMRREFIASVSHELKTPLTVIVGFLETLQDMEQASDDESRANQAKNQAHYLDLMQTQARSMQRLVDDLLTLSSLEYGTREKEEEWFEVAPLLQQLLQQTQALSQGKHVVTLLPPKTGKQTAMQTAAKIHGVHDDLASAFANLLSNAVRYTPEGGEIGLSWWIDGEGRGILSVRDSGIGIAAEHLPRLTERFYRVDRGRSRAMGGTGLGLAIVKHVLLRHQGELLIDSQVGKGSTFSAVLPAARVRASSD